MSLVKQPSSAPGTVNVTFRVPSDVAARTVEVLGDFTGWDPVPMDPTPDGGFETVIDLRAGAAYRFRYRLDGERWENDWAADGYVPNDYGSDDSLVDLTAAADEEVSREVPERPARPAKKAAKVAKAVKQATKAVKKETAKRASGTTKKSKASPR